MVHTNSQIIEQKLKALSNVIGEGRSISRDLFAAEGATVRNSNRTSLKLDRTAGEVVAYTRGGMERGRIDAITFVGMERGLRELPGMAKRADVFRALSDRIKAAAPKKRRSINATRGPLTGPERQQIVTKAREGLTIAQRFRANRGAVLTNPKNGQSLRFDEASGRIIRFNKAGEVMDSVSPSRLHALELAGRERRLIDEAFGGRIRRKADGWLNQRADIIQKQETVRRQKQKQNEQLALHPLLSDAERKQLVAKAREGLTIAQKFRVNRGAVFVHRTSGDTLRFDEASGRIIRRNKAGKVLGSVSPIQLHARQLAARERHLIGQALNANISRKLDGWFKQRADIIQVQEQARRDLQKQSERRAFQQQGGTQRAQTIETVMRTLAALDYDPKAAPTKTSEPRPTAAQGSPPKKLNLRKLADQSAARVAERPEKPEAQRTALAL